MNVHLSRGCSGARRKHLRLSVENLEARDVPSVVAGVLDANRDIVLPSNGTPIVSFSNWNIDLLDQVGGVAVSGYQWDLSAAPDAVNVAGQDSAELTFSWASFTGAPHTDRITVSAFNGGSPLTATYVFEIRGTDSATWVSQSSVTYQWPNVLTPDQLNNEVTEPAGPYATIGLADGTVQTSHSLPSYNPNVTPLGLTYNSVTANQSPIFQFKYQLDSTQPVPTTVSAQLTLTDQSGNVVYAASPVSYDPSDLNPGDWMVGALQLEGVNLPTDRYNWEIDLTAGYPSPVSASYTGGINIIDGSTTPTALTNDPFGPGWSLAGVSHLWIVSDGAIVQNADGSSEWFSLDSSSGTYQASAGDFSGLFTYDGTYLLSRADNTELTFNAEGQETLKVDPHANGTWYTYDSAGELASVTDMNGQVNTLAYGSNGLASAVTDPAGRQLILAYGSTGQLSTMADPDGAVWSYTYNGVNALAAITDPRGTSGTGSYTTSFQYDFAGRVNHVVQPDGTSESLDYAEYNGMVTAGNSSPAYLWVASRATFTDGNGNEWVTYLDDAGYGQVLESIDPLGDTAITERDPNGLPWIKVDPLGRLTGYTYFGCNVTSSVNDDGSKTVTSYALNGSMTVTVANTDAAGNSTSYSYDQNSNILSTVNAAGDETDYTYNTWGLIASCTANGNETTYTYDDLNRKIQESDPLGATQSWVYDAASDVTAYTNQDGYTTTYSYNAMGKKTQAVVPQSSTESSTYTYTYDAAGNLTSVMVPLYYTGGTLVTETTTYVYDGMNRLISATDALGDVTTCQYDGVGNLTSVIDPRSSSTVYTYDAANRETSKAIPVAMAGSTLVTATTTYNLDAAGEIVAITNPLNQTASYSYDLRGWVASVTDPEGNQTLYGYDPDGNVASATQVAVGGGSSEQTTYTYTPLGAVSTMTDPAGDATSYGYDGDNHLISISGYNNGAGSITYTYDGLGRQLTATDALGDVTTYQYDGVGNLITSKDPLGRTTIYTYNEQNQLSSSTAPLGITSYTYNLAGWKTAETDPDGNTTAYGHNSVGWVTSQTDPNGYTETMAYDADGNLTSYTDFDGRTIDYAYNLAGRSTSETWVGDNYTANYTYDLAGNLTGASDPQSTYSYAYTADNQLAQTTVAYPVALAVGTVALNYGYDGFGNQISLSDTLGTATTYSYTSANQLAGLNIATGAVTAQVALTYTSGLVSQIDYTATSPTGAGVGDDIQRVDAYDSDNRVVGVSYSDATQGTTLASFAYTYDAAGQIVGYTGPDGTNTYAYDANGQLESVAGAFNQTYSFDGNGNRNSAGYMTSAGNEMTQDVAGNTFLYDPNGNLVGKTDAAGNVWTYTYDYRNRLTAVVETSSSGNTILSETLVYDVHDNLIGTIVNDVPQEWTVYDAAARYLDFSSAGAMQTRYIADPRTLDAYFGVVATGAISWYATDNLGSVRAVVDTSGNVLDQLTYSPFGAIISESDPAAIPPVTYAGGHLDPNLDLYHFGARWYDPNDGRWTSEDPEGLTPSPNWYDYVGNAPLTQIDPLGLYAIEAAQEGGGQGGGGGSGIGGGVFPRNMPPAPGEPPEGLGGQIPFGGGGFVNWWINQKENGGIGGGVGVGTNFGLGDFMYRLTHFGRQRPRNVNPMPPANP